MALGLFLALHAGHADFAFVHVTDLHYPVSQSRPAVDEICRLGAIQLVPFGVTAPAPSFVIATGDLTEFGGGSGWWKGFLGWWAPLQVPIYYQSGNHDSTWSPLRPYIRELHGDVHYGFDHGGVHFVGLDTASPCDPRPYFDPCDLRWLAGDLQRVGKEKPVIVFMHHTPTGSEFSSPFAGAQLLEILRPYNVIALLLGHNHNASALKVDGFDGVVGGSTFGKQPGYNVVFIDQNRCRMAYKLVGQPEATVPLLDKSLIPAPSPPPIVISHSGERGPVRIGTPLLLTAVADPTVASINASVDGGEPTPLTIAGARAVARLATGKLLPGRHYLRVNVRDAAGAERTRSAEFSVREVKDRLLWRVDTGAACKTRPCAVGEVVVVGGTDGLVRGYALATGEPRFAFQTGGDVLGGAAATSTEPSTIVIGSADGNLYGLDVNGHERWRYAAGSALYALPVIVGEVAVSGTDSGAFHCVEVASGRQRWVSREPQYSIEAAAAVKDDTVFFGAWDTFVYALDLKTGNLRWKTPGAGSATQPAARYYSPADCGPVAVGDQVLTPDRAYLLSFMDISSGARHDFTLDYCAALAASPDGTALYLRRSNNRLTRMDANRQTVWEQVVPTGAIASPPTATPDSVYVVSNTGTLSILNAADGSVRFQYQVTPQLYVMAPPTVAGGRIFIAGMDGSLTALRAELGGGR